VTGETGETGGKRPRSRRDDLSEDAVVCWDHDAVVEGTLGAAADSKGTGVESKGAVAEAEATLARARYGVDGPGFLVRVSVVTFGLLVVGIVLLTTGHPVGRWFLLGGVVEVCMLALYLHATLSGKHQVWARELDALGLTGGEQVLDLGCGRGAVLVAVARRLTTGRVVGIDLWRGKDQSGNTEAATRRNATAEGVTGRVDLVTGDMRSLPFEDGRFDLVVASLAVHNVPGAYGRATALTEAMRVLRPGGRLRVADIAFTGRYAAVLRDGGAQDVAVRRLGWRTWFAAPWFPLTMVSARKPCTAVRGGPDEPDATPVVDRDECDLGDRGHEDRRL
jgi:arsenite methyltransferase